MKGRKEGVKRVIEGRGGGRREGRVSEGRRGGEGEGTTRGGSNMCKVSMTVNVSLSALTRRGKLGTRWE